MKVIATEIPEVRIVAPDVFGDARGFFLESWNERAFAEQGIATHFVQDNHSHSQRHVLRGLHYQVREVQAKLVRVIAGAVYDVAVDVRRSSPTCGRWVGVRLAADDRRELWIPAGFAHGFLVLSDTADVLYKASAYYSPQDERCIRWDDPDLAIAWPLEAAPLVSAKDERGLPFREAELLP